MISIERESGTAFSEVERVWRENRCLSEGTITLYRTWAQHFVEYCRRHRLQPKIELTYAGTTRFITRYDQRKGLAAETLKNRRTALHRKRPVCTV